MCVCVSEREREREGERERERESEGEGQRDNFSYNYHRSLVREPVIKSKSSCCPFVMSRRGMAVILFIFLLTHCRPKHYFYINLESHFTAVISNAWKAKLDSGWIKCTVIGVLI